MRKIFILLFIITMLASCNTVSPNSSYREESKQLSNNQERLIKTTQIPQLQESLERKNIIKRSELFNKSDKLSYIYLVSYGKIISFHTIKGKISSVSSYLTPQEKLVTRNGRDCDEYGYSSSSCYAVQAPDIDGSYGTNGDAIFFFTTEGAYVEWKGEYLVSDFPLQIVDKPSLTREIK